RRSCDRVPVAAGRAAGDDLTSRRARGRTDDVTATHETTTAEELRRRGLDHLWLHFARMGSYDETSLPVCVRGDGCYLEDVDGRRCLDGLAGLFAVQIGYSHGDEIGQAALEQMRELPFSTTWGRAHPRAIELAAEVAELAPGDLNRVFFTSGGSEAVESAWKLARQYFLARGARRAPHDRLEGETRRDELVGAPPAHKYKANARPIAY